MLLSLRANAFFILALIVSGTPGSLFGQVIPDKSSACIVHACRFGVLAHDVDGIWSRTRAEGGVDVNAEIVFRKPGFELWKGLVLPNIGVSVNTQGGTSKLYAGVIWEFRISNRLFFNSGIGLSLHDGHLETGDADDKELGSRILFRIPFEIGYRVLGSHTISVLFDHISNAYLYTPNEGLDTIGVRYGFHF